MREKEIIKIILKNFSENKMYNFSSEPETKIIQKLLIKGILSKEAFKEIDYQQKPKAEYIQKINVYPLTKVGIEQKEKNIYLKVRDSLGFKIIRDIILLFAFILSVIYTLNQLQILN